MSEKPQTKTEAKTEATKAKTTNYLFPNGGDIIAFSCQAENLEEATTLNEHHIKQQKEGPK